MSVLSAPALEDTRRRVTIIGCSSSAQPVHQPVQRLQAVAHHAHGREQQEIHEVATQSASINFADMVAQQIQQKTLLCETKFSIEARKSIPFPEVPSAQQNCVFGETLCGYDMK